MYSFEMFGQMEGVNEMDTAWKKSKQLIGMIFADIWMAIVAISFSYANGIRFEWWTLNGGGIWQTKQGCNYRFSRFLVYLAPICHTLSRNENKNKNNDYIFTWFMAENKLS